MKYLFSFVISLILLASTALSWQKADVWGDVAILNPYNDQEVVFVGSNTFCTVNLATGKNHQVNLSYGSVAPAINGSTKRLAIFGSNSLRIYNYLTGDLIADNVAPVSINMSTDTFCFSADGSKIYVLNKATLRFITIDPLSAAITGNFILNLNPNLYSGGFIVPEKDEFVLRTTDSLQFWSITGQNLLRTLPFNGLLTNVRFLPGGDKITYSANTSDIYVINSNDGSQVFHLNVGNRRFDYFDFSANMKYLMFSDYYQFSAVYDTQNLQYIIDTSNHYYPRNIVYMTSDSSRAIAKQMITFYCNRNAEDPIGVYVYFDFDLTNDKRLNSIPEGFVAYPGKIVFNKDGSLISVWGQRYQTGNEPTLIALLNTADSSFIKYIDNAYPPIAFSPDSKYLLCIDSNKIQFHNIETNSVDRVLETDLNSITGLYYTPDGNTIVAMNNRYVNIYDNTTLNLFYKLDHSAADKNLKIMVQSQNGDIYFLEASNRLFTLLPLTGTEEETTTLSLPGNPSIADLTTDGRYLLCNESFDSLYVYDVINRSIKYSFKIPNRSYDDGLSDGFFGSEQDVWIDYIDNPVNNDDIFQGINLITGNMYYLMGEFRPFMSPDGAHYSSRLCPRTYYYSEIPDGLKTVVEDSPGRAVYSAPFPNPAVNTVRINCEYPVDNMTIILFDYNGRQVEPALYEATTDQSGVSLNIGYLTHGLYFINLLSGNKIRYTGMVVKN